MRVEIRKLHQRLGTTTLFVTHDQIEAMTLADRIVVMNKGGVDRSHAGKSTTGRETTYVAGFIGTPGLNLISGTVDSARGMVAVADGQQTRLRPRPLAVGRRRAGDGRVSCRGRAHRRRRGALKGEFDFAEEMGAARLLHGTFGGETVVANVADAVRRAAGDALHVSVDPADIQSSIPKTAAACRMKPPAAEASAAPVAALSESASVDKAWRRHPTPVHCGRRNETARPPPHSTNVQRVDSSTGCGRALGAASDSGEA